MTEHKTIEIAVFDAERHMVEPISDDDKDSVSYKLRQRLKKYQAKMREEKEKNNGGNS